MCSTQNQKNCWWVKPHPWHFRPCIPTKLICCGLHVAAGDSFNFQHRGQRPRNRLRASVGSKHKPRLKSITTSHLQINILSLNTKSCIIKSLQDCCDPGRRWITEEEQKRCNITTKRQQQLQRDKNNNKEMQYNYKETKTTTKRQKKAKRFSITTKWQKQLQRDETITKRFNITTKRQNNNKEMQYNYKESKQLQRYKNNYMRLKMIPKRKKI